MSQENAGAVELVIGSELDELRAQLEDLRQIAELFALLACALAPALRDSLPLELLRIHINRCRLDDAPALPHTFGQLRGRL